MKIIDKVLEKDVFQVIYLLRQKQKSNDFLSKKELDWNPYPKLKDGVDTVYIFSSDLKRYSLTIDGAYHALVHLVELGHLEMKRWYDPTWYDEEYLEYREGLTEEPECFSVIPNSNLSLFVGSSESTNVVEEQGQLNKIICVETLSTNSFKVVVNDDYSNYFYMNRGKKNGSGDILYRVAVGEKIEYGAEIKSALQYLNNSEKCKLYSKSNTKPGTILETRGGVINSNIIRKITDATFKKKFKKV